MIIPTYGIGSADPDPIFYTHEAYQRAEKRVYPYALQDDLTHVKQDKAWKALRLENDYLRITVLPEIGGRLFEALDKTNNYDFFYRQHVIKPALIGMLGAWISGGVEWCAFHHHRNTTYMPVDATLEANPDGSKTIWLGETERRHRMRWLIGLTLHPDRACLEVTGKFINRTALPNSILYWANVAVSVNKDYQVIFPPSVQAATYHGKIDFTTWPIGQGRYMGNDYRGVDLSWWKNNPNANSFFTWRLQEDFMGGYDHGRQAGVVHIGNHHVVCGAKLWEWGTGPAGMAWSNILTDADGPYAELMVGAYSDNQPDYSWIKPYEVKTFKQYWYPVRDIGGFKNATLDGAVNLELEPGGKALFAFSTTASFPGAKAVLTAGGQTLWEATIDIAPGRSFKKTVQLPAGTKPTDLRAALRAADGRELVAYRPAALAPLKELPQKVERPAAPGENENNEELFLTGLRMEQIHDPEVDPTKYYEELLRRDPADTRANTLMGQNRLRRGLYAEAEKFFRTATGRLSAQYTRPGNTEALYGLGLAQRAQGKAAEAYDSFYRASWDAAFHTAAFMQLAELSCRKGEWETALEQAEEALATNTRQGKVLNLKAALLRRLGRARAAQAVAEAGLALDPIDFLGLNESALARLALGDAPGAQKALEALRLQMRDEVQAYLELATDYANWGMCEEAIAVLQRPLAARMKPAATYPMVHYLAGWLLAQKGEPAQAAAAYGRGAQMPAEYCFPFRPEEAEALRAAIAANPKDARAQYYLGNLLFDDQPEKAMQCWEKSIALDGSLATAHRNLGWALDQVRNDVPGAIAAYEKALNYNKKNPRLILELDNLYDAGNVSIDKRLALLENNHEIVKTRVETLGREAQVMVLAGKYEQAVELLDHHYFHVAEGADDYHNVYMDAHLLLGLKAMKAGDFTTAREEFLKADEYPDNLQVGRPVNDPRGPQVAYLNGLACEALKDNAKAERFYRKGAEQRMDFTGLKANVRKYEACYDYYQALCQKKLGHDEQALQIFNRLMEEGNQLLDRHLASKETSTVETWPTLRKSQSAAHYMRGLSWLEQGQMAKAHQEFAQAVKLNQGNVWAQYQLGTLKGQVATNPKP